MLTDTAVYWQSFTARPTGWAPAELLFATSMGEEDRTALKGCVLKFTTTVVFSNRLSVTFSTDHRN